MTIMSAKANLLVLLLLLHLTSFQALINLNRFENDRSSYAFIKYKYSKNKEQIPKAVGENSNLRVESPGKAVLGSEQNFLCRVPSSQTVSQCIIINPQGQLWTVEGSSVLNGQGAVVPGYQGLGAARDCGLKILSLQQTDIGDWTCEMQRTGGASATLVGYANIRQDDNIPNIRLPRDILPLHYDLTFIPMIEPSRKLDGMFTIMANVTRQPVTEVTLHIRDMSIVEESIRLVFGGFDLFITHHGYDFERQFYKIGFNPPGLSDYEIEIIGEYKANLQATADEIGFYYDSYTDSLQRLHELAVTQHESTFARMSFPGFDEPDMKATFTIKLAHTPSQTALSSMPSVISNEPMDDYPGYLLDTFATTPPMSSYVTVAAVSDMGALPCETLDNGVEMIIYSTPDSIAAGWADWPQSYAAENLRYYEQLFQVPYPLPKCDMFVSPSRGGAMENWGLITYGVDFFLFDPVNGGPAEKELATSVVTHELIHQWFGNLVTMQWWSLTWLNEGFATFLSYYGGEHVAPEMTDFDRFTIDEMHGAMYLDSFPNSHPVNYEDVIDPDDAFDRISYDKGGSIVRMMHAFLTEATFFKGVTRYLTELQYSIAVQDDLWRVMNDVGHEDGTLDSDKSIKEIMETWTEQKNYPVLSVQRLDGSTVRLTQSRFLTEPDPDGIGSYAWWIPITYTVAGDASSDFETTSTKLFMSPSDLSLDIPVSSPDNLPLIFNIRQTGFYRVNYEPSNWALISNLLQSDYTQIALLNRASLLDDVFALAEAGTISYTIALDATKYLASEVDYVPFFAANIYNRELERHFRFTAGAPDLDTYQQINLASRMTYLGIDESDTFTFIENLMRLDILPTACLFDTPECVDQATARYAQWMQAGNPDDPSQNPFGIRMRQDLYCASIRQGGQAEWDFLSDRFPASSGDERNAIVYGLACTKDSTILTNLLDRSLNTNDPLNSELTRTTGLVAQNDVGKTLIWPWIENNWTQLGSNKNNVVTSVANGFSNFATTQEDLDILNQFLADYGSQLSASATQSLNDAIAKVQDNMAWNAAYYDVVLQWLQATI